MLIEHKKKDVFLLVFIGGNPCTAVFVPARLATTKPAFVHDHSSFPNSTGYY